MKFIQFLIGLGLAVFTVTVSAHVSISEVSNSNAGSRTEITFTVPHGCGDKSTLKIITSIPEEITANDVTTKADAVWKNRYIDVGNNTVSWSGGNLSIHDYTKISIRTRWPELEPGEGSKIFEFPLTQVCSGGEQKEWLPSTTVYE